MITLRKMDEEEFRAFRESSVRDYAEDLMAERELSREQALCAAENEFDEALPDGLGTESAFLMNIEENGRRVGWIWFRYSADKDGGKHVFLADLLIFPAERRKGYAAAAIREMNGMAEKDGCVSSVLFVWDQNPAGMKLYEKCGYKPGVRETGGTYMVKELGSGS